MRDLVSSGDVDAFTDARQAYQAVMASMGEARGWYLDKKRGKRWVSKWLRGVSLILALGGGVLPLASSMAPSISPFLGYIFLAVAAGLQVFDQFFGSSEAWSRHVVTALRVGRLEDRLRLAFSLAVAEDAQEPELIKLVQEHSESLWSIINGETQAWTQSHSRRTNQVRDYVNKKNELAGPPTPVPPP